MVIKSNTREKPYLMAAALWNVVFSQRLAYVSPPQDFARMGQRIRLAKDISSSKISACLDTSVLFGKLFGSDGVERCHHSNQRSCFCWRLANR